MEFYLIISLSTIVASQHLGIIPESHTLYSSFCVAASSPITHYDFSSKNRLIIFSFQTLRRRHREIRSSSV